MIILGYDCWKRKGLIRCQKLENVGAETTSSGSFHKLLVHAHAWMDSQHTECLWQPTAGEHRIKYTSAIVTQIMTNSSSPDLFNVNNIR